MPNKKRVLVVDDERGILNFVRVKLTIEDFDVLTTTSGEEALTWAESEQPDIILLDILMVPMSGLEVLDRLRKFSKVPVIVFTGKAQIIDAALELGATDYIPKPFDPDTLVTKIQAALSNTETAR